MSSVEFPIIIKTDDKTFFCKLQDVPGKSYSKVISSNREVAVLYSPGDGSSWSVDIDYLDHNYDQEELIFNSDIVLEVAKPGFSEKYINNKYLCDDSVYESFMKSIGYGIDYSDSETEYDPSEGIEKWEWEQNKEENRAKQKDIPYGTGFPYLKIAFIPIGTMFRIKDNNNDGYESIEIFHNSNYIIA